MPVFDVDVVILGGGLHGGLTALALSKLDRPPRVLIVEASNRLAGDQVWSCHTRDVGDDRLLLDALPTVRWPSYDVRFPNVERTIALEYRSMHASKFADLIHDAVRKAGFNVRHRTQAEIVDEHHIQLSDGKTVSAEWIIDARGHSKNRIESPAGWQKFLGIEIECEQPHGLERPCVMDAVSAPQRDGYRFVYTLPFTPNTTADRRDLLLGRPSRRCQRVTRDDLGIRPQKILAHQRILREEHGVASYPLRPIAEAESGGKSRSDANRMARRMVSSDDRLLVRARRSGRDGGRTVLGGIARAKSNGASISRRCGCEGKEAWHDALIGYFSPHSHRKTACTSLNDSIAFFPTTPSEGFTR